MADTGSRLSAKALVDRLRRTTFAVNHQRDPEAIAETQENIRRLGDLDADGLAESLHRLDAYPETISAIATAYGEDEEDRDADDDEQLAKLELRLDQFCDPELDEWIDESLAAMHLFLDECGSQYHTFLRFSNYSITSGAVRGRLSTGFVVMRGNDTDTVIWQSRDFVLQTLLPTAMHWVFDVDLVLCTTGGPKREPLLAGPLIRFHPERFRRTRHYAKDATQFCHGGSLPTLEEMQGMMELTIREMNARRIEVDRRDTLGREGHMMMRIEAEECLAIAWAKFVGAGRQIFDVPARMCEMLRHTDVDDVPVNMLRLPYPVLYLHFGSQVDMEIEPKWHLDGAYIEHHPEHQLLTFTLTARPQDDAMVNLWHAFGEPVIVLSLPAEVAGYDLGTAIDHQLAARLNQLRSEQAQGDRDATDEFTQMLPPEQRDSAAGFGRVQITTGTRATAHLEQAQRHAPILRAAMRLVVNALCYLTAYPDDLESAWPEGTPQRLRQRTESGTPKEQARARSKLEALGYTAVNLCGRRLEAHTAAQSVAPLATAVRPHWRRGHWRRQAHGEGLKLRRIIWIMPTIVRAGEQATPSEQETLGHVYRL